MCGSVSIKKFGLNRLTPHCAVGFTRAIASRDAVARILIGKASKYVPGGEVNSTISGGKIEISGIGSPGSRLNIFRSSAFGLPKLVIVGSTDRNALYFARRPNTRACFDRRR